MEIPSSFLASIPRKAINFFRRTPILAESAYDETADFHHHLGEVGRALDVINGSNASPNVFSKVADIGGGQGMHAAHLVKHFSKVVCIDIIDYSSLYDGYFKALFQEKCQRNNIPISYENETLTFQTADAQKLPFDDETFSCCLSINAFEHIPKPDMALREALRVLEPGGLCYITFDPLWTADTGGHFYHRVPEPWGHLVLGDNEFVERMKENGGTEEDVKEYLQAMNRKSRGWFERMFNEVVGEYQATILKQETYKGVTDKRHLKHKNYNKAIAQGYTQDDLLTRSLTYLIRR
jgi:ubiquinone/menaquinone biosynthesis C-methylase UbiE